MDSEKNNNNYEVAEYINYKEQEKHSDKPFYLGHRKRLKNKFLSSTQGSMSDYELLELLLFLSHPRHDTKPIAKKLIDEFGSFFSVINADQHLLEQISGVSESVIFTIKIIRESVFRMLKQEFDKKPILQSWKSLIDYCRATMGDLKTEQFRILYLNTKNILISDELQETGTINHTPVYIRNIVKRALILEAASLILVHNHPSGDVSPSKEDIDITQNIITSLSSVGILVHEHLIIAGDKHFSFKLKGLI